MFLNGGKEPFPLSLDVAEVKEKGLINANMDSRSVLSAIGLGALIFFRAAFFVLMFFLFAGLAFSPIGIFFLFYILLTGCLYDSVD